MIIFEDLFSLALAFTDPEESRKTLPISSSHLRQWLPSFYCSNRCSTLTRILTPFRHKGSMNLNIDEKCLVHEHTTGEKSTTLMRGSKMKIIHWWDVCVYVCVIDWNREKEKRRKKKERKKERTSKLMDERLNVCIAIGRKKWEKKSTLSPPIKLTFTGVPIQHLQKSICF